MGSKLSITASSFNYSNKGATEIPHEMPLTAFYKLKQVNFSLNKLSSITNSICTELREYPVLLDMLTEVDLSSNQLSKLPNEICLLIGLKKLNISSNQLEALPENFFALFRLEKLFINHNRLKEIPHGIISLSSLKILRLHDNNLSWLPRDLGNLSGLKELTIHVNPFFDKNILDISELPILLRLLKSSNNYQPSEYSKKERALKKEVKLKDHLHELKGGRMFAFRNMLYNKSAVSVFGKFMEKEFANENLEFYWAVDKFRYQTYNCLFPLSSKEVLKDARAIYERYIKDKDDENEFSINIPSNLKSKLDDIFSSTNNVSKVDQWVFSESYVHIIKLMLEDSLKRFCQTPEGKSTWSSFEHFEIEENKRIAERNIRKTSRSPQTRKSPRSSNDTSVSKSNMSSLSSVLTNSQKQVESTDSSRNYSESSVDK